MRCTAVVGRVACSPACRRPMAAAPCTEEGDEGRFAEGDEGRFAEGDEGRFACAVKGTREDEDVLRYSYGVEIRVNKM